MSKILNEIHFELLNTCLQLENHDTSFALRNPFNIQEFLASLDVFPPSVGNTEIHKGHSMGE